VKIWQVVPYFPPHIGGEETCVFMLSRGLAAKGHDVTVFTSSESGALSSEDTEGFRIRRLNIWMKVYNNPIVPSLVGRLLHEDSPTIIHAHQYPIFFSDVSALMGAVKHIPLLLQIHVIPDSRSMLSSAVSALYYESLWKLTLKTACKIIVPSRAYRSLMLGHGLSSQKVSVIPYGVDTDVFHPDNNGDQFRKKHGCEGSRVILTAGRLNYQKGLHVLIEALPLIKKELQDVKLVIVGDGEERPRLKKLAQTLDVAESVVFTGSLHHEDLPQAFASADVFVLPSFFESFGITLIEAQATAKPVVATRVGGIPEVVMNGESGTLVEPGKPNKLANAIITILSDRNMAVRMGRKGRKHVEENFSWCATIDKVAKLYEESLLNMCAN
jgi:glycosyltransferase involved in cell wall biosynthesis